MALRKTLLVSLDDLLAVVREFLNPNASRSGLDRCLRRHGVGNLRDLQAKTARPKRSGFKAYEPGYLHIDVKYLPQMADESSRRYLFVAIDRATRWVFIRIFKAKTAANARRFLRDLERACPIRIRTILTDRAIVAPLMEWMAPASGIAMCHIGCSEHSQQMEPSMDNVTTIGIDLAKSVFQLHGVDAEGSAVLRRQLKRSQMLEFFQRLPSCLIGMEACASAHYWARELRKFGHKVRLMQPSYVKGYVKRGKTDGEEDRGCSAAAKADERCRGNLRSRVAPVHAFCSREE